MTTKRDDVKQFDPTRRDNRRAIADAARLGWFAVSDGKTFADVIDLTYGLGKFWAATAADSGPAQYRPRVLLASDLNPDKGDVSIDFTAEPRREWCGRFDAAVLDPPYALSGRRDRDMDDGYGIDRTYTVAEVEEMYRLGALHAAFLVRAGGSIIIKHQPQVAGGRRRNMALVVNAALRADAPGRGPAGERPIARAADELFVVNNGRPVPASAPPQVHARANFSILARYKRTRWPISA